MSSSRFPFHLSRRRVQTASSLLPTLLITAAALSFLGIAAAFTSQNSRAAARQQGVADLVAASDSALEYAYAAWKAAIVAKGYKPPVLTDLSAIRASAMSGSHPGFATAGISFTQLTVDTVDQNGAHADADPTTGLSGAPTQNVPNYPGWTGYTYYYQVDATVSSTHYGGPAPVHARRFFQLTQVPLFQAALFYENKLELHPGSSMIVNGLIHTNSDLWAQGFQSLQFKSNVSYVGNYHEAADRAARYGWDGTGAGLFPGSSQQITWSDNKTTDTSTAKTTQLSQVSPIDPFGGAATSNNGLHDLIEVPPSGDTSPQKIYNDASLYITIDSSKSILNPARVTVTGGNGVALSTLDMNLVKAAVDTGVVMYDQREQANVTVTSIDMGLLNVAVGADTSTILSAPLLNSLRGGGFNGVIYVQDVGTNSKKAIRLRNGRKMPGDMTIASNNAVYVQGDFNTGGLLPLNVPSNISNTDGSATPTATGYTKSSVSIMADAVTVLSNNWSDLTAALPLALRNASPTTVNAAILAGDVPTNLGGNGTASGGAHNFIRFLENWNNVNFTYWGSLVEAFYSEKFTGLWQTNNVYYWPNRKWNFDNQFINHPPPGTPQGLQYSRGRWERN